ncbi:MAG: glycerol kinase GlpK [Spirochaetales bacterium]|nr:glycerol kinase GlpK [Spirochaetales bacterium]
MPKKSLILSIDQGTSGSKAVIFDTSSNIISIGRASLQSSYPREGWVEQNPEEIFKSVLTAVRTAIDDLTRKNHSITEIISSGISNQRETFLLWDSAGTPLTPAIVWQCKRSIPICEDIIEKKDDSWLRSRTGLFIDPYFSGTKLLWLYHNNPDIREKIDSGKAYFGTIDTWLVFRLTEGKSFKTDYTNASRTLLFNLKELKWDTEILKKYNFDKLNLADAQPSGSHFGESSFGGIFKNPLPITGVIGDSHAAAFGERCFDKGTAKATMGTGCSVLLNTGEMVAPEKTSMVSTICWSTENTVSYALEGIIVSCGATLTWLRSQLGLFNNEKQANDMADSIKNNGSVFLIPAFSGLGAPWWKMNQKAEIRGLTFNTDKRHIVRAGLESIAYQITDVIKAMENHSGTTLKSVQIDGGVSASSFITGLIALLNTETDIIRCELKEASALGAALLSGLTFGAFNTIEDLRRLQYNDYKIKSTMDTGISDNYQQWTKILQGL